MINVTISDAQVQELANDLTPELNARVLREWGLYGVVTQEHAATALGKQGWLRKYLQAAVDIAFDNLFEDATAPNVNSVTAWKRDEIQKLFDNLIDIANLPYLEDVPEGCFCSDCHQPCEPEWYDSKNEWVPSCHSLGVLYKDPMGHKEMEIEDILDFADGPQSDAYYAAMSDLRATERSAS